MHEVLGSVLSNNNRVITFKKICTPPVLVSATLCFLERNSKLCFIALYSVCNAFQIKF